MLLGRSLELFIENLKLRKKSKSTIDGYSKCLRDFSYFIEIYYNSPVYLEDLMVWDLELYLKYQLQKGIEPISINRSIYILRSFYSFLEKRKIISENIARLLEPMSTQKKERTSLDREEIKSLVDKIDHPLIKTVVITLANTGLRISELVNLKLSHVDLDHRLINVVNGKGGKNRKIPINKELHQSLAHYLLNIRQADTDNFFATRQSGSLSPQYVNKIIKDATLDLAWDKHITAHSLRHSFASNLIRQGVSIALVQKLLGHADLRVTSIYIHNKLEDLEKAVEKL